MGGKEYDRKETRIMLQSEYKYSREHKEKNNKSQQLAKQQVKTW
jgi:hypothetical protein